MSYNHIIKTTDDRVLYFFQNKGLCVKNLLKPNENYKIIYENAVFDFDVIETEGGEVAIICQDDKGSIIFLNESESTYLKTTLLNNRSQTPYDKCFKLHKHNKWLSLIYVINYQGNSILSHQLLNDDNLNPIVVDYISDLNIFSFTNKSFDIYAFYNRGEEFGYKIFTWSKKHWEEFISLGKGRFITGISDKNDNIYLIYEENESFFVKIIKNVEFTVEIETTEINFLNKDDSVNLIIQNEEIWIIMNRSGFLFGIKTDFEFKSFSNTYNFINEGKIILYNISINEEEFKMFKCFGYESNLRPKLILYKDLLNVAKTIKPSFAIEENTEINEFANINKAEDREEIIEINKLKIIYKELENEIKKLSNKVKSLESSLKSKEKSIESGKEKSIESGKEKKAGNQENKQSKKTLKTSEDK